MISQGKIQMRVQEMVQENLALTEYQREGFEMLLLIQSFRQAIGCQIALGD